MKPCLSSSGCPSLRRPAARSGVSPPRPVVSLASSSATGAAMRRQTSVWAVGHAATKAMTFRMPRVLDRLKATAASTIWASRVPHPAGSSTTARTKRTAQKPGRPSLFLVKRPAHGEPTTDLRRAACPRDAHAAGHRRWHRRSARNEVGRRQGTTGAEADGNEGIGGLHTSDDVGERVGARTRPSKGGPSWCDLSKGPMTGASTPEESCHCNFRR